MEQTTHSEASPRQPSAVLTWTSRIIRLLLMVVVIVVSVGISYYWLTNRPRTERRPPRPEAVLVEVVPIEKIQERIVVSAMGTVLPATEIQLAARINGQIVEVPRQFVPGGYFDVRDLMLRIEPADYELAVRQQEGNLTRAESEVRLEMGQQAVAHREYELIMDEAADADLELLLRRPQLASKEAAVATARAALDKAKLDLERTRITAPFNAIVKERRVELGAYVAPGASLATLIGTDEFWVEITVPVDDLAFIPLPDHEGHGGATVRVYHEAAWGPETWREGRVVRLLPDLEPQGRMARLLVAVADPLAHDEEHENMPPLLLGSFVRVSVEGHVMDDVVRIPRTSFHGGDTIWIMNDDRELDVRTVQPVWGTHNNIYVADALQDGELLVVSDLATPVAGMLLRTADMPVDDRPGGEHAGGAGQQRRGQS